MKIPLLLVLALTLVLGCAQQKSSDGPQLQFIDKGRPVPAFNADTAYHFIERQLADGPRVPNTYGHARTRVFLEQTLTRFAGEGMVYSQEFTHPGYSDTLELANIIGAFNPTATDRIMLCAHWDTRPRADEDTTRTTDAIEGADDGGSGVAVLLELARMFSENPPPVGVDIILFDGEDYGTSGDLSRYFLGSRYWSSNPPVPGYQPRFGILLDMVGAKGAQFPKEEYSMSYAPNLVEEVWSIAAEQGFETLFLNEKGAGVLDDHYIVNQITRMPIINIINHERGEDGNIQFGSHWHTHADDISIIDPNVMQAVGEVLAELIYNRL
ncbi:MAG: M28 family peptidase [Bacteroidota bacterium]